MAYPTYTGNVFTGIIEELGTVAVINELHDAVTLNIASSLVLEGTGLGDSIAVNGVCLTVTALYDAGFCAHVMKETLHRSALGKLTPGSRVNLERAVQVNSRLGGHIVQGHVDGTGVTQHIDAAENHTIITINIDTALSRYIVDKGSITVNGVSLTVTHVNDSSFTVSLIPATLLETNLGGLQLGDVVNIEVDVLAKYVEKLGRFSSHS